MIYAYTNMECSRHNFFVILGQVLLFYLTINSENQNFEKIKKIPGDIIILHLCITNDDHIMYGSGDIKHDRQSFLSFRAIFCHLNSLANWKILNR